MFEILANDGNKSIINSLKKEIGDIKSKKITHYTNCIINNSVEHIMKNELTREKRVIQKASLLIHRNQNLKITHLLNPTNQLNK
jgi:hypothetical protein